MKKLLACLKITVILLLAGCASKKDPLVVNFEGKSSEKKWAISELNTKLPSDWENNWHHVAAAWQGSWMLLAVDGLPCKSTTSGGFPANFGDTIYVGNSAPGDESTAGLIDELRISHLPRFGKHPLQLGGPFLVPFHEVLQVEGDVPAAGLGLHLLHQVIESLLLRGT